MGVPVFMRGLYTKGYTRGITATRVILDTFYLNGKQLNSKVPQEKELYLRIFFGEAVSEIGTLIPTEIRMCWA